MLPDRARSRSPVTVSAEAAAAAARLHLQSLEVTAAKAACEAASDAAAAAVAAAAASRVAYSKSVRGYNEAKASFADSFGVPPGIASGRRFPERMAGRLARRAPSAD